MLTGYDQHTWWTDKHQRLSCGDASSFVFLLCALLIISSGSACMGALESTADNYHIRTHLSSRSWGSLCSSHHQPMLMRFSTVGFALPSSSSSSSLAGADATSSRRRKHNATANVGRPRLRISLSLLLFISIEEVDLDNELDLEINSNSICRHLLHVFFSFQCFRNWLVYVKRKTLLFYFF